MLGEKCLKLKSDKLRFFLVDILVCYELWLLSDFEICVNINILGELGRKFKNSWCIFKN